MSKYETLDRLIMAKIGGHPKKLSAILVRDVRKECERIASEESAIWPYPAIIPDRILERRIQALKRISKIRSTTKGWIRVGEKAGAA